MNAAGTIRCGAAPDALVAAWAVAVLARLEVDTTRAIVRTTAISAFRVHAAYYSTILALVHKPQIRRAVTGGLIRHETS